MLYLFSGDDTKNKLVNYEKFVKSIPKDVEVFFVSRNNFNPMQIESLYSGASLFSAKCSAVFQNILDYEENRDFILNKLKMMGESNNDFVFIEGKLNKSILDAFKKARAELNIFELSKEKKEKFNSFLIANAFANKDKLNTWICFRQAIGNDVSLEEISGIIFWKIKDMILKKNFSKFKEEQLKNFVSKISYIIPEARKEGRDAESVFEQFLLEAF